MRLSSIRMAGFKSFVEPARVRFATNLTGVVGPNGCGKSNIIDAVRWVLGESARNIRGQTLGDVIFDGAASRQRLDQAAIELTLDNEDGAIGGEHANYSEIKIRREVRRDQEHQSRYYLNGAAARRRDIADLFQGTGLGRGNYAIIAQGMVQGLIEARPEDMRKYLEEAAGISLYRERRRETENSIQRTEANLEQSRQSLRDLERQLKHLERQKRQAEEHRELRREEAARENEWTSLQLRDERQTLAERDRAYERIDRDLRAREEKLAAQRAGNDALREQYEQANRRVNEATGHYYQASAAAATVEQKLQQRREERERAARRRAGLERDIEAQEARVQAEQERLGQCRGEAARRHRELAAPGAEPAPEAEPRAALAGALAAAATGLQQLDERIERHRARRGELAAELERDEQGLDERRRRRSEAAGGLAGLQAQQRAELAGDPEAQARMLAQLGLAGERLADCIEVDAGWEFAVETVLADALGAVCVEALPPPAREERAPGRAALLLLDRSAAAQAADPMSLASRVRAPVSVAFRLGHVLAADTLEQAAAVRARLLPHQSVVLPSGLWLGPDWMRWPAAEKNPAEGVLDRQREIDALGERLALLDREIGASEEQRAERRRSLQGQEEAGEELQRRRAQAAERRAGGEALLLQLDHRQEAVDREREALRRLAAERDERAEAGPAAPDADAALEAERARLQEEQRRTEEAMAAARRTVEERLEAQRAGEAELRRLEGERDALRGQCHEMDLERQQTRDRCNALASRLAERNCQADELLHALPADAAADDWQARVERIRARLENLPPINEAAISEHAELLEEKAERDRSHADIEDALRQLNAAIAKIDRETRDLFRNTFNRVNEHLKEMFPRIIGAGGRAELEMTEQNLLSTGIEIRACPPGKRTRTMHMLSGGEQAMVAVALMLALFRHNPAPFCILDEVDAPLSDDNLRRFCEIVVEMSDAVQFIVVTHNKITMEHVDQLIGVTMHEPGVSRLVDVNVEQAVELAERAEAERSGADA